MKKSSKKSVLFILSKPPYQGLSAKEALDAVLAASIYDVPMGVVFLDDGVFQLMPDQDTSQIEIRSLEKPLSALELYGIERLFVHEPSLSQRGGALESIKLSVTPITDQELTELMAQYECLINF